jgi:hypothetical protein
MSSEDQTEQVISEQVRKQWEFRRVERDCKKKLKINPSIMNAHLVQHVILTMFPICLLHFNFIIHSLLLLSLLKKRDRLRIS